MSDENKKAEEATEEKAAENIDVNLAEEAKDAPEETKEEAKETESGDYTFKDGSACKEEVIDRGSYKYSRRTPGGPLERAYAKE